MIRSSLSILCLTATMTIISHANAAAPSSNSASSLGPAPTNIPNAIHYPIYIPLSGGVPNFFSSSGFAPQWPGNGGGDANLWNGMAASETLGDWTSPLMEVYDEQQLQAQRDRLRQKLTDTRARQERFRQQQQQQQPPPPPSQRRSYPSSTLSTRTRDNDPFESYANEQQQSASVPRKRVIYAYPNRRKFQVERNDDDEAFSDRYGMASW